MHAHTNMHVYKYTQATYRCLDRKEKREGGGASGGVGAPTLWDPGASQGPCVLLGSQNSPSQSLAVAAFLPSIPPVHLNGMLPGVPSPAGFHLGGHQGCHPQTPCFSLLLLADDQTRVILSLLQEEGHGDYINGNFIRVRLGVRKGAEVVGVAAEPR